MLVMYPLEQQRETGKLRAQRARARAVFFPRDVSIETTFFFFFFFEVF